jgi:ligand-binding sensor domain-containing protein/serine phosphatase RsbU (regulator of sigma subunit)
MKFTLVFIALVTSLACSAQSFKFDQLNEKDGLNNKFIYSINQNNHGVLLVGTGEGLFEYDGLLFKQITTENGLANNFITCSLSDSFGTIWYGHANGFITKCENEKYSIVDLSAFTVSRINHIYEAPDKSIWVVTQNDGLLMYGASKTWKKYDKGIEDLTLYTLCQDNYNNLWIGTDMGLIKAGIDSNENVKYDFVEEILESKVTSILVQNNQLIVGTEDLGLFNVDISESNFAVNEILYDSLDFKSYKINHLFVDSSRNLWISTNNKGLVQLSELANGAYHEMIDYNASDNKKTVSINLCFIDKEGNIWLGTIGEGMMQLEDSYLSLYNNMGNEIDKTVYSVYEQFDTIWYGTFGEIIKSLEKPNNILTKYTTANGLPESNIKCIYNDDYGNLWVGTADKGAYKLTKGKKKFESIYLGADNLTLYINDILGVGNTIYIATDFGVYSCIDGIPTAQYSVQNGLSHNVVKDLYKDSKSRIWIGTHDSQIAYVRDGVINTINTPYTGAISETNCITEDNEGNIWIGTAGTGIVKVSESEPILYDKRSGLYSDYCYSIVCDNRNNIWVGHIGAISKVNLVNNKIDIIDPSQGFEYSFMHSSAVKFPNGNLLFGTDKGLLRYEPEKDKINEVEPNIRITQVFVSDSLFDFSSLIKLSNGEYKLDIQFQAVSLKNPVEVTYQYMLEGYDTEWSELTYETNIAYSKLGPGTYTFKVRAYNSDMYGGNSIASFTIFIDKPFWQKWWFILFSIVSIILAIRFFIKRREKKLIEEQAALQKALDEATYEITEQKDLLEIKNKDIMDSIHYAKNIQKAMLPPQESLKNYFTDAFVYYKPRDIVSGDFYWIEKLENEIIVACADCTGHGVPGAFMSLIGTTTIKDVVREPGINTSSQMLDKLDSELRVLLNKQGAATEVEDGMDISLFYYNVISNKIMVSSANRPVLLRINGEWIETKGDRQSIGGSNASYKKDFTQSEYNVNTGDLIYMFSDGITDQFGGPEGKKIKRSGVVSLLQKIADLPMDEQRRIVKEEFNAWKGKLEQIDDVIVMGIRF